MVFNGDADDQDLCTIADGMAGSSDSSFPLKKKAAYANLACRKIWTAIWRAYGGWIADDYNNSGEPEVKVALTTTARNVYAFATAQLIDAMEWLDSSGNWNRLKKITLEEIIEKGYAETNFMTTAGDPIYYRPVQNGVRLYPDSSAVRANALKARLRRDISPFTSTSTTAYPGFDSIHHEAVAIFMAMQYAKDNTLEVSSSLVSDWNDALNSIVQHWKIKYSQNFPRIKKARPNAAGAYVS